MTEIPVTAEMLAAGRAAGAATIGKGVFHDEWWAAVYRAMREAESPPSWPPGSSSAWPKPEGP